MEQRRIILIIMLVLIGLLLRHNWVMTNLPQSQLTSTNAPTQVLSSNENVAIQGLSGTALPASPGKLPVNIDTGPNQLVTPSAAASTPSIIEVKTDVMDVNINPLGGTVSKTALLRYPEVQGKPAPVMLMNSDPAALYLAQSALVSTDNKFNDTNLVYRTTQSFYDLSNGQKQIVVNLTWEDGNGLKIIKSFTFIQGQYTIDVMYAIQNKSASAWQGNMYGLLSRKNNAQQPAGLFHVSSYTGASISTQSSPYQKISFKEMQQKNVNATSMGGWAAMQQHYFLSAWVPNQEQTNHYFSQIDNNSGLYTIAVATPVVSVNPGELKTSSMQLYAGPELAENLKPLASHLDLTIDYGWLWFISEAIFWLMQKIYNAVGNWGWSIVLVTIIIKLAFYHLSATSYRSMAKMRKLQPKLQSLKDRYGDDKQKLAHATMELYRQEKANPMSGCLPILVQIPVFIALYWVLIESVQLRQAPFILWIHDLSSADPYFILPVINGVLMFVQQKLNPPPPDPTQAKIMMFLPLIFTFIFMNFPAGLVLYWVVNSGISILQQWYIMRQVDLTDKQTA